MENSTVAAHKVTNRFIIRSSNSAVGIYPKQLKARTRYLYIHAHKGQKCEATQVSMGEWIPEVCVCVQ